MSENKVQVDMEEQHIYSYSLELEMHSADDVKTKYYPRSVDGMAVIKDYRNTSMPVVNVQARFDEIDIARIQKIEKSVLCNLTISALKYNFNPLSSDTQYILVDRKILYSTSYIPIFDKNTFDPHFKEEEEIMRRDPLNPRADAEPRVGSRLINFSLFMKDPQQYFKLEWNKIIRGGNVIGTALMWIIDTLPIGIGMCVVDEPDNTYEQTDMIIPPMNTIQMLNFLQAQYGIYENGLLVFHDIDDHLYILNRYKDKHEKYLGQPGVTTIVVTDPSNGGSVNLLRSEESDGPMYKGAPSIKEETTEILDSELDGDAIVFTSFQQGLDVLRYDENGDPTQAKNVGIALLRNVDTHTQSGTKVVNDYDELNNLYNMSSEFNKLEANAIKYKITLSDVYVEDFKPNMYINLKFENVKLNNEQGGVYYINDVTFLYKRNKNENLTGTNGVGVQFNDEGKGYQNTMAKCSCILSVSRRNEK